MWNFQFRDVAKKTIRIQYNITKNETRDWMKRI